MSWASRMEEGRYFYIDQERIERDVRIMCITDEDEVDTVDLRRLMVCIIEAFPYIDTGNDCEPVNPEDYFYEGIAENIVYAGDDFLSSWAKFLKIYMGAGGLTLEMRNVDFIRRFLGQVQKFV